MLHISREGIRVTMLCISHEMKIVTGCSGLLEGGSFPGRDVRLGLAGITWTIRNELADLGWLCCVGTVLDLGLGLM